MRLYAFFLKSLIVFYISKVCVLKISWLNHRTFFFTKLYQSCSSSWNNLYKGKNKNEKCLKNSNNKQKFEIHQLIFISKIFSCINKSIRTENSIVTNQKTTSFLNPLLFHTLLKNRSRKTNNCKKIINKLSSGYYIRGQR